MSRSKLALAVALVAALLPALLHSPAAAGSASGVVISEFRFRGPAGASDEFVELANVGAAPVEISHWRLQACAGASGAPTTRASAPAETMLDAGDHYLFAPASYTGLVSPDASYAVGIADDGGVRITSGDGAVVDGVGSSDGAVDECREGAGLELPTTDAGSSFVRTQDTDDNAMDFAVQTRDPQACGVCTSATPTLSITDAAVEEGDAGTTVAHLTASLARPVTRTVEVGVASRDETAMTPADYARVEDAVVFAAGERSKTVSLSVIGDLEPESDETFALELLAPTGAVAADPIGRVTILDDDNAEAARCRVLAVGRVSERPSSLLLVAVRSRQEVLKGFVLYREGGSGTRLLFREVTALTAADHHITLSGRDFRLELGPGKRVSLSHSAGTVEGILRPGRVSVRCASP